MNAGLTIQEKLKDLRVERGLTLEQLEERTGISKSALGNYETDEYKDISHTKIVILAKFYGVSCDYLLGLSESKNHPNADLAELHLSDDMIDLLKHGKINARLLCEMAAHKDFIKLMADIEIYVDGIASMQLQNLNSVVNMARNEIEERYRPDENDPHIQILNAAHIDEDDYFCHVVHKDIDSIIQDIKKAHKHDTASAPDTNLAQEIKQNMEWATNIKGSHQEKKAALFCKQLGIDYSKLAPDEFLMLIHILEKSKLLNVPGRKKRRK